MRQSMLRGTERVLGDLLTGNCGPTRGRKSGMISGYMDGIAWVSGIGACVRDIA